MIRISSAWYEEVTIHRQPDYGYLVPVPDRGLRRGPRPGAWLQHGHDLPVAKQVRWHRRLPHEGHQGRDPQCSPGGKALSPSQCREMARNAVLKHALSVRLACECLGISEICYRFTPYLSGENVEIAHWLLTLTETHKRWGFGLCFAYLRDVKGFRWSHKRVYRLYRELELNLRI